MSLFDSIILNGILLFFPILIYLVFLSVNKNINNRLKNYYQLICYLISYYLLYKYGINNFVYYNAIIAISYLDNKYIISNILTLVLLLIFKDKYMFIIFIIIFENILYLFKNKLKILNFLISQIYVFIIGIISLTVYRENINILISYMFVSNICLYLYEEGNIVLSTNLKFNELQNNKKLTLSLFKITHEIKNPIAVIKGYLDMLNTNNKEQVNKYIPIIKDEIQRLLTILQDFLMLNKINLDLDIMDLNMLIEDTISKLNPLLKEKNIKLKNNLIDDEVYINGDYNRLSQVIINILKNSIEAIESSGQIKISSKIYNNNYYITIEDNGIGMTEEVMKKMRDPFYTTKKRGSGLGVSLIYEIVEAHNSKIEYFSKYGKGTKVVLEFPIYE